MRLLADCIDYGLFAVTRFREELAAGHRVEEATARTIATAGRTVVFSAVIIAVSLGALLTYPIGVLRSVPYGGISAVLLAALLSVTTLPAALSIVGHRIEPRGWHRFARVGSTAAVDPTVTGYFSRLALWVMQHPARGVAPVAFAALTVLTPLRHTEFGGLSERYLAADHPTRMAQERFDFSG